MTSESNRISAASTSYVDSVCRAWGWSWSEMGQADDDGLDGLVYLRAMEVNPLKPNDRRSWKHQFTGGLIHVQVKSGASYVASETQDHLVIKITNLAIKRDLWLKSPLPVALVYVKEEPMGQRVTKAWWADLKLLSSFAANDTIIVPKKNRFQHGIECRQSFGRLAIGQHRQRGLQEIDMSIRDVLPSRLPMLSGGAKFSAWNFYQKWRAIGASNPELGAVIVNRTGWSHITRVGRPVSRIQTSFDLLPAGARILATVRNWQLLRRGTSQRKYLDGSWGEYEYLGLSAMVNWTSREPSEVMVILRRQTILKEEVDSTGLRKIRLLGRKTWFYSIYEPGRGKRKN